MNRILNKRQAICGTVWILVVCAALILWPLRLIHEEVRAESSRQQTVVSEEVNADYVVQQRFIAQYDRLKEIEIYLADRVEGEKLNFVLRDASMRTLMRQMEQTKPMMRPRLMMQKRATMQEKRALAAPTHSDTPVWTGQTHSS